MPIGGYRLATQTGRGSFCWTLPTRFLLTYQLNPKPSVPSNDCEAVIDFQYFKKPIFNQ